MVRSCDVVFNEDTICTDKVRSKSRKQVSFDLTLANPKYYVAESRESMDNISHTTLEDYEEVTNPDANLLVTFMIPASHKLITESDLNATE